MTHSGVGIVAAAIGLGVMILVHEWGHFIVARLCGVRVEVFSIGFGNRIFGWKRGNTDYRISVFPLGGYVKMAGIPIARYTQESARIAGVIPGSVAEKSGLKAGDKIVSINGTAVSTWNEALSDSGVVPGMSLSMDVERNGVVVPISENVPKNAVDYTDLLGYPKAGRVVVDTVQPGFPAAKEGLQAGDEILSANGVEHPDPAVLAYMIRSSGGKSVQLKISRDGKEQTLNINPTFGNPDGTSKRWVVGALFGAGD